MVHKEMPKGKRSRPAFVKPDCPACHSKQTQFRKTDLTHWCRVCGCEFKLDEITKLPVVTIKGSLTPTPREA